MHKISKSLIVATIGLWSCFQWGCSSSKPVSSDKVTAPVGATETVKPYETTVKNAPSVVDEQVYPDISNELGRRDSAEGFNRSMAGFNFFAFRWVLRPVGSFWSSLFPRHVINCFNRFSDNVAMPRPLISCALQAKFADSGLVFTRFMINTTAGVAGFYDPAQKWFGIDPSNEDFGQAFASWGCGPGTFLTLPVAGPTNIRDGCGLLFDYALDPKTYFYGGQSFAMLNKSAHGFRNVDVASRSLADPYEMSKEFYCFQRYILNHDYDHRGAALKAFPPDNGIVSGTAAVSNSLEEVEIPGIQRRDGYIDTLLIGKVMPKRDSESMWVDLSWWNTDFFYRGSVRSVALFPDRPEMDYKVWLQDKKDAPLAVIIPGTGGFYTNLTAATLAELYYDQGYSSVVMSSSMNWQFVESASSTQVPGLTSVDAADTRNAIAAVITDLEKNKDRSFPQRILTGVSLGGMTTLFIAAMEKKQPLLKIDRYLAVNPPVDMLTSIRRVDGCIAAWKNWPEQEFFPRLAVGVYKYMGIAPGQEQPFGGANTAVHEQAMGVPQAGTGTTPAVTPVVTAKASSMPAETSAALSKYTPARNADYLPFGRNEAKVLIGLTFKMTIAEIMMTIHRRTDMGILKTPYTWGTRTQLYHEINEYNFEKYCRTFLVKYYSETEKHPVTIEELNRRSSLEAIMPALAGNDRIRIIQTGNDFLETDAERAWLHKQFGSRCVIFRDGGHLGELYYAKVQDKITEFSRPTGK